MRYGMNGHGSKVTRQEQVAYQRLREIGYSPQAAAQTIGRSKSWAYQYEQTLNERPSRSVPPSRHTREPMPAENLSDAVELVLAVDRDDNETAFGIVDKFGAGILPYACKVAMYLASVQAGNMNDSLRDMLEGEPMADELEAAPIEGADILLTIPPLRDRYLSGQPVAEDWSWYPPRAREWMKRMEETYPELAEVAEAGQEALASDDPRAALKALREEIREGDGPVVQT